MARYKYVLSRFSLRARIERLACTKETAKFVTLIDEFGWEVKHKKANCVYDTWEEAHAALTCKVEAELNTVRLRLQHLQGIAGNVRGLKPPADEPPSHQEVK